MGIKSKKIKITTRERTKYRIRKRIIGVEGRPRLTVFRSGQHIHCQAIEDLSGKTLASASTLEKGVITRIAAICADVDSKLAKSGESEQAVDASQNAFKFANDSKSTKSSRAAFAVGFILAERLKALNLSGVVFDRNGCVYHGRVKALAEGARMGGLKF